MRECEADRRKQDSRDSDRVWILAGIPLWKLFGYMLLAMIRRSECAAPESKLPHIALACLMLLAPYLQHHHAEGSGRRRCCLPPLGLEKPCSAQRCRAEQVGPTPFGETVHLVNDGRDRATSIVVQRGPRGGGTVGFCPVPCRLVFTVKPHRFDTRVPPATAVRVLPRFIFGLLTSSMFGEVSSSVPSCGESYLL